VITWDTILKTAGEGLKKEGKRCKDLVSGKKRKTKASGSYIEIRL
jgi:hypothetical protein